MVSWENSPPKNLRVSIGGGADVFALGLAATLDFGGGGGCRAGEDFTTALREGRERALACPRTVATWTLGSSSSGFWEAVLSCELNFSQLKPDVMSFALSNMFSTDGLASGSSLFWAFVAALEVSSFSFLAASAACSVALVASSSSFAFSCVSA